MVKVKFLLIFGLLIGQSAFAVQEKPMHLFESTNIYTANIPNPSVIGSCANQIWVYSVSNASLYSLDTVKAYKRLAFNFATNRSFAIPLDITAIACYQKQLLVLLNSTRPDKAGEILKFQINGESGALILTGRQTLPFKERTTDLFCSTKKCWLLQNKVLTSQNLVTWTQLHVPPVSEIEKLNSQKSLNPFDDWQSDLLIAKGSYIKGTVSDQGQLILLDPFSAQLVIQVDNQWKKWGSFGAWEGSFLGPKSVRFISEDLLAIADTKLKLIFLYSAHGKYLGILGNKNAVAFSPQYPAAIAVESGTVFVSDFSGNTVSGFVLAAKKSPASTEKIQVLQNLFRRPEVLQETNLGLCLTCHDGTVTNQLYKYTTTPKHHPIACAKCHDPHHVVKARHYLRAEPVQLCVSCHKEYADKKTNHVWTDKKKGGQCMDCHQSHSEQPKILIQPMPQLCTSCHQSQSIHHRSVENLTQLEQAKDIQLQDGKISCNTCHLTHVNWREAKFIRAPEKVRQFCSSCHGQKTEVLYKQFHRLMKEKGHK